MAMFGLIKEKSKGGKYPVDDRMFMQMVDNSDNLIMLADMSHENVIFYMNKTAKKTFSALRDKLNENFNGKADVVEAMNSTIHKFHKDPERIRRILSGLGAERNAVHSADIPIGDVVFRTKAYPIWDSKDPSRVVCYMACWSDITADRRLEAEQELALDKRRRLEKQVGEIADAIQQMTSAIREVARGAAESAKSASGVSTSAKEGSEKVVDVAKGLETVARSVRETAEVLGRLGSQSQQIGQITETISSIADQTNLLALNAAIEAARAGDHGRGFAVVAEEVRSLAQRSQQATEEINAMVNSIARDAQEAVGAMEGTQTQVVDAEAMSKTATKALELIVRDIASVDGMITQIAAAGEEQSVIAEQVSRQLEDIKSA